VFIEYEAEVYISPRLKCNVLHPGLASGLGVRPDSESSNSRLLVGVWNAVWAADLVRMRIKMGSWESEKKFLTGAWVQIRIQTLVWFEVRV